MLAQELHSLSAFHSTMNSIAKISVDASAWTRNKPRTPKTGFPEKSTATIQWRNVQKSREEVSFTYYKSGCNRDTFIAVNHRWILKGMALVKRTAKKPNKPVENQCRSEWEDYRNAKHLDKFLLEVFLYCEMVPEGVPVAVLAELRRCSIH